MAGVTAFLAVPAVQPAPVAPAATAQTASAAPHGAGFQGSSVAAGVVSGAVAAVANSRRRRTQGARARGDVSAAIFGWGKKKGGGVATLEKEELRKAEKPKTQKKQAESFECIPAGRELEETAQDRIFHWLGKTPKAGSKCFEALQRHFPNALPSQAVHEVTRNVLAEELGFKPETTLLGSSFCPDEINNQERDLPTIMREYYGNVFPMGGIGGAPYVGETGFAAFSGHVADNGDIIVVFGPHVGISMDGQVGKYLREGQGGLSTACGAVIGAYNATLGGAATSADFDSNDMQMDEIKKEFAPHAKALSETEDPMAACAYQAFEFVKDRMMKIVNTKFGSGRLVLIGGIQINMPYPEYADHFLPLFWEVRQEGKESFDLMDRFFNASIQQDLNRAPWAGVGAQREVFSWMTWSPPPGSKVYQTLHQYFPGALPGQAVHKRTVQVLDKYGFTVENTLLGTSFCSDEINNEDNCMSTLMQRHWGAGFPMGGISGTPFSGKTGFGAFSSHVADEGNILVAFGPHVGISKDGEVGKCERRGQANVSGACGAVIGAYNAILAGTASEGGSEAYDMQFDYCKRKIAPHAESISRTENPMASLSHQSYEMVKDAMFLCVNNDFGNGYLCLLGGIQINMPAPYEDHFYPVTFELRKAGEEPINLINELKDFS